MTVSEVKKRAIEVIGEEAAADRWLSAPKPALDGKTPLELAQQSEDGEQQVMELLGRLEHGVFS